MLEPSHLCEEFRVLPQLMTCSCTLVTVRWWGAAGGYLLVARASGKMASALEQVNLK